MNRARCEVLILTRSHAAHLRSQPDDQERLLLSLPASSGMLLPPRPGGERPEPASSARNRWHVCHSWNALAAHLHATRLASGMLAMTTFSSGWSSFSSHWHAKCDGNTQTARTPPEWAEGLACTRMQPHETEGKLSRWPSGVLPVTDLTRKMLCCSRHTPLCEASIVSAGSAAQSSARYQPANPPPQPTESAYLPRSVSCPAGRSLQGSAAARL